MAEQFADRGLAVDTSVELDERDLNRRNPPELETAIYRIVQEALTNATRHGYAGRAVVEIVERNHTIHLTVRDDGRGFDPAANTDGFGLHGMRERAELLGGTLTIDSAPGQGATVTASFPLRGQRDDVPRLAGQASSRGGDRAVS